MDASIRFITRRYWPSLRATAQLVTDLAEGLADRGYRVAIICAAESDDAPRMDTRRGVRIYRVGVSGAESQRLWRRGLQNVRFYSTTLMRLLMSPAYDLNVFLTAPPFVALLGRIIRSVRRQRYAIWSHDLHPEAEVAAGILRESASVARLLARLERQAYVGSEFVVDLGRCMSRRIRMRGVPSDRLRTIPVWSRPEDVRSIEHRENAVRQAMAVGDGCLVMYAGNAGIAHRFEEVLEAMLRLRDDERIRFLFVGGGPRKREIEAFIRKHELGNCQYHGYVPREELPYILSAADVHLITLRASMAGIAVPCKMAGIMGAGRPIVMLGPAESEVSLVVREAACGVVVEPGRPESVQELAAAIGRFAGDDRLRAECGRNGQQYFEDHLTAGAGIAQWDGLLQERLFCGYAPCANEGRRGIAGST